ncbi:early nodulin-like protein 1 [Sesamum indicum]|uniref:Early nodulin-like protein 1 n=1 Tax=Sesamum indicum TaxID=4182 RepID=A0A6I9UHY5_SESIN|nr:early nodulin-like protein 1 [Sesamum indicum]
MADHHRRYGLLFLVFFFSGLIKFSFAYQFVVGGRQGWVVNTSENYNHWAERMRFQVNDTLLFKYKKGSDSVLVVNKDDYDNCNTGNPILKLDDGNSVFKFDRSGPFFFISGNKANCDQGQKLIIVVLAVRNRPPPPPNAPVPSAAPPKSSSSPSPSPTGGAPSPASSPLSPSPAGEAPSPATSPLSPSPSVGAPAPASSSPSPSGEAPAPGTYELSPLPGATSPSGASSGTPGSPNSSTPGDVNGNAPGGQAVGSCVGGDSSGSCGLGWLYRFPELMLLGILFNFW